MPVVDGVPKRRTTARLELPCPTPGKCVRRGRSRRNFGAWNKPGLRLSPHVLGNTSTSNRLVRAKSRIHRGGNNGAQTVEEMAERDEGAGRLDED